MKAISERGLSLIRQSDNVVFIRHKDDVKPFVTSSDSRRQTSNSWYYTQPTTSTARQDENNTVGTETQAMLQDHDYGSEIPTIPTDTSNNDVATLQSDVRRTKFGRIRKPPSWFRDYEQF